MSSLSSVQNHAFSFFYPWCGKKNVTPLSLSLHAVNVINFIVFSGLMFDKLKDIETRLGWYCVSGTAVARKRFALALAQHHAAIRCHFWVLTQNYMMVGQDLIMQKWLGHSLSIAFSNKIFFDRVLETDESLYCVSYRKNFLQLVQHTSAIQQFIYYLFV